MVNFLSSEALSGILSPPKTVGLSPLFRAKIKVNGNSLRCYLKPMPDDIICPSTNKSVPNREIVSEALGYVIAKSCGLLVPKTAGIILLQRNQLPSKLLPEIDKITAGTPQQSFFCWFSEDMEFPNIKQKHLEGVNIPILVTARTLRLARLLRKSADTPKVIAFDEWLANTDRHLGNLLSPGGTRLMLIDHGRILSYPNWSPGGIGSMPCKAENRLGSILARLEPKWYSSLPTKSAMVMSYNSFSVSFRADGETAARDVLKEFFGPADIQSIVALLKHRHDPAAYAKSMGMVI